MKVYNGWSLKRIMEKAHDVAGKMEGDYMARLSGSLKLVWHVVNNEDVSFGKDDLTVVKKKDSKDGRFSRLFKGRR